MLKRTETADGRSCWNKAADDEMIFVLLGRDIAAPATIRAWIQERIRLGKNRGDDHQIVEAHKCANFIEAQLATPVQHMTQTITSKQRELIRHALGFDGRQKMSYRNHFVTGPGTTDYDPWMGLVSKGLAIRHDGSELSGGDPVFWVTREAALSVREKDEHLSPDFRDGREFQRAATPVQRETKER